jgi:hypothetical protein
MLWRTLSRPIAAALLLGPLVLAPAAFAEEKIVRDHRGHAGREPGNG